ncbi:MAG: phosphatidate cytidylyltransferase [Alistipes sp.]|nr:phosphatidate cytidylyltransferase [Alistipes sp.]
MNDKSRNLIVRTLSGAVLLGVVLAAAFFGKYAYGALLLFILSMGMEEFYTIVAKGGIEPQKSVGQVIGISLFGGAYELFRRLYDGVEIALEQFMFVGAIVLFLLFVPFILEVFRAKEHPLRNIAATLMGVIYVALPRSLMLFIPLLLSGGVWRAEAFLFYLFIVWGNDVFAYLVGVSIGKHRMCERISPKKSWEGFVGGILGALAMGALGNVVVGGGYLLWLGLALVVALSSVLGDLVESMFKREVGIKDSGNILPGHGGMLDRFDALIISVPFAFAYLVLTMIL